MDDPAPPGNEASPKRSSSNSGPKTKPNTNEKSDSTIRDFGRDYKRLVTQRLQAGLLAPFQCARCDRIALDPVARNGKHEWICEGCERVFDMLESSSLALSNNGGAA